MPTPYTEGNGCAYLWKTNTGYQCSCQAPEVVPCTCYSLIDAMKCDHFEPESWDVEEFITQLTDKLRKEGKRIMDKERGIECIDAIKAALECHEDPIGAWLTGQCIKYLWRWPLKNGLEDLKKCRFYLDRLIESFEEED